MEKLVPGNTNSLNAEAIKTNWKTHQEAAKKLRELGTNILPRLMQEVRAAGITESTNRESARPALIKIAAAFEVLKETANPLVPALTEEFRSARSLSALAGLQHIGGTEAGLVVVTGITNPDPYIHITAMGAVSYFTNHEVKLAALKPLLERLKDDSEYTRALAASGLGSPHPEAELVIPALITVATNDLDSVVRQMAIKSIGSYGTNASSAQTVLEKIALEDRDRRVRELAQRTILALQVTPRQD